MKSNSEDDACDTANRLNEPSLSQSIQYVETVEFIFDTSDEQIL